MKYAGLFLLFSLSTFAYKSDQLILRGRVPASIDMVKLENSENIQDGEEVLLNVPKHKYKLLVHRKKDHKVIDIIFN